MSQLIQQALEQHMFMHICRFICELCMHDDILQLYVVDIFSSANCCFLNLISQYQIRNDIGCASQAKMKTKQNQLHYPKFTEADSYYDQHPERGLQFSSNANNPIKPHNKFPLLLQRFTCSIIKGLYCHYQNFKRIPCVPRVRLSVLQEIQCQIKRLLSSSYIPAKLLVDFETDFIHSEQHIVSKHHKHFVMRVYRVPYVLISP